MTEVSTTVGRPAWWVRVIAALPWWLLNRVADFLAWLAFVIRLDQAQMRASLAIAFPDLDQSRLRATMREFYRGFSQVLVEVIKSTVIAGDEIRRRVKLKDFEPVAALLAAGQPVLLVAAHQCNWEWMLQALVLELGVPVDAAYKPLVDGWAQREMLRMRARFGATLVPAQELLGHIIRGGKTARVIAMVADQEPRTSEKRHWTRFLNRDTAFYMGAEEITRVTRFPAFFVGVKRTARGCYEISAIALVAAGERTMPGEITERYARLVEAQIQAAPPDWPWTHKRWKLKRSLYGK